MEEMESQIREEIRKGGCRGRVVPRMQGWAGPLTAPICPTGFAELQTDMTDLTKELNRSQGIPFLEYKHFVTRTFFPKVHTHLPTREGRHEFGSRHFGSLLSCP